MISLRTILDRAAHNVHPVALIAVSLLLGFLVGMTAQHDAQQQRQAGFVSQCNDDNDGTAIAGFDRDGKVRLYCQYGINQMIREAQTP